MSQSYFTRNIRKLHYVLFFLQEKQKIFKVEVMDLQVRGMFIALCRWIRRKYSERRLWKELSSKSLFPHFILRHNSLI